MFLAFDDANQDFAEPKSRREIVERLLQCSPICRVMSPKGGQIPTRCLGIDRMIAKVVFLSSSIKRSVALRASHPFGTMLYR